MKDLKEMSWQELVELRKDLEAKLGEDQDGNGEKGDKGDDDDQLNPPEHWIEDELVEALGAVTNLAEAKRPGPKEGTPKSPPKGYPTSRDDYADPTNYKYPLSTETFVRAALGYFSKPHNRKIYSPEEQKFMWRRIIPAAKRYDIELSDDIKKRAEKLGDPDQEVNDLDEKKLAELVEKKVKEQMEAYAPQVRVPPDIAEIKTALEGFKAKHAEFEKKFGELDATYQLSAMAEKVKSMEAAIAKLSAPQGGNGDNDKDTEKLKKEKEAAEAAARKVKEQAPVPPAPPVPQGQVATSEMATNPKGVPPPSFHTDEEPPQGFTEVMTRAGRRQRR